MAATYTVDMSLELVQGGTTRLPDCLSIIGFHRARDAHTVRALVRDTDADPNLDGKHVQLVLRVATDTGATTEVDDRIPYETEPVRLPAGPNEIVSGTRYSQVNIAEQQHELRNGTPDQPVDVTPDPRLLTREKR